ncbi:SHOCT-like domain-containing protein [Caldanaerobacter subterraneus]|uniref:SHOCT-like domain-containing protein n=1 Tax=Caldanaerobacter subterraneus TaxID=911092 RepID=UPI0034647FA3
MEVLLWSEVIFVEERLRILKMVEEKKITAEEAAELLKALEVEEEVEVRKIPRKFRWLKIKVTDINTNKAKVNLSIPYSLVAWGMRIAGKFTPRDIVESHGIDFEGLLKALEEGETGKIVDVYDKEDGEHVEISLE